MMRPSLLRLLLPPLVSFSCGSLFCQTAAKPLTEPGLEMAVKWKWWVAPSGEKNWGLPLAEPPVSKLPGSPARTPGAPPATRPDTYLVEKGDALILIAKKFGMKAGQLKTFNELKDDHIRIGQVLRIPTTEQLQAMAPPEPEVKVAEKKKKTAEPPKQEVSVEAKRELENILLQAFLDREQFSPGPVDGKASTAFMKLCQIYENTHEDVKNADALKARAQAVVGAPCVRYTLRAEDFRFIRPPKAGIPAGKKSALKEPSPAPAVPSPLTYDELTASDFLAYLSPWEFVAERFHCDEALLRRLNPGIRIAPGIGTEFQVPNVSPFEIENAFAPPLQPAAGAAKITATIVELTRLEIYRDGKLVALAPLASARPGLRGRGSWTVLDAIPRPRLATKREFKEPPKLPSRNITDTIPTALPVLDPPLEEEQYLPAGPNNPAGILWINLAKAGSTEPLPYGLHGTSIPSQMSTQTGLGGLRLTNWDIARVARLLPAGTMLQWKTR